MKENSLKKIWKNFCVRRRRKGVLNELNFAYSFIRDEGRPFEVCFQELASNHSKLLQSKAVVVSI
jgi:hypothetical protein